MLAKLRILFDNFTLILIAVIVTASLLPAHGQGALVFEWITALAIALLFFYMALNYRAVRLLPVLCIGDCTCWCLPAPLFYFLF